MAWCQPAWTGWLTVGDVCFTGQGLLIITGLLSAVCGALGILYKRVERNADEWKQLALENLSLARESVVVAKTTGETTRERHARERG